MEKIVGKYRFEAAGFDIEVKIENGKLVLIVPRQPTYTLQRTGERQFKIVGAPDGFSVKFTPAQGDATEMYLQQPQGNYTLPRVNADGNIAQNAGCRFNGQSGKGINRQIPSAEDGKGIIEVKEVEGKVALVLAGQPPYELREKEKDLYNSPADARHICGESQTRGATAKSKASFWFSRKANSRLN